ncbi:MAG: CpaE family protein, partial [Acutalibacteraceae bacterium]
LKGDNIVISGYSDLGSAGKLKAESLFPDIVICAVRGEVSPTVFSFIQQLLISVRNCIAVLVSDRITVELVSNAARFGVKGVIPMETNADDFEKELLNIFDLERQRRLDTNESKNIRSKVLSFFGGKGGTGKTTMAVNVATQIAKLGKRTMLIDLDLQFGDVTMALDLNPRNTIVELVQDRAGITIENINSFSETHNTGLSVLGAPKNPEYAEYIKPEDVEKIIDTLRPYFEYIVLDLPPVLNDPTITAIENSEEVYMVYNMDILSLKNAKACVDVLKQLNQGDKLKLVINKNTKSLINAKDFEKTVEIPVYAFIGEDSKLANTCINKGIPIMLASPQSEVARDIKEFVRKILDSYTKVKTINEDAGKKTANPLKRLPTKKPEAQKPEKKKPAAKK